MLDPSITDLEALLSRFRPQGEAQALERVLDRLAARSLSDASLRSALLHDPRSALTELGVSVPPGLRIVCHEGRPGHFDLVKPLAVIVAVEWTPEVYQVLRRAADDRQFAGKLLRDPRSAIEEVLGQRLPATIEVSAWVNTVDEIHVVLPAGEFGTVRDGELSDADLELVAGGNAGALRWLRGGGRTHPRAG